MAEINRRRRGVSHCRRTRESSFRRWCMRLC